MKQVAGKLFGDTPKINVLEEVVRRVSCKIKDFSDAKPSKRNYNEIGHRSGRLVLEKVPRPVDDPPRVAVHIPWA